MKITSTWLEDNTHRVIRSHRRQRDYSGLRPLGVMALVAGAVAALSTSLVTSGTYTPQDFPQTVSVAPSVLADPTIDTTQLESDLRLAERASRQHEARDETATKNATSNVERMIGYALAQVGKPYRFGTQGTSSFDCSGLIVAAFRTIGIKLYHYTGRIVREGRAVTRAELARGDIVFPLPNHVGIYLGNNQMVHASSSKGRVVIGKVYSFYAARRLL